MSIENNASTIHCGVRLPGGIRHIEAAVAQLCEPQPPGRAYRFKSERVSDECGAPVPTPCATASMLYPTCYRDPNAAAPYDEVVLDGYKRIDTGTAFADLCYAVTVMILDLELVEVTGAIEVVCERSGLPGFPAPTPPLPPS